MFNEIWGDYDEEEGDYDDEDDAFDDDEEHHLVGLDQQLGVVDNGQAWGEGGHVQVWTVDHGLLVVPGILGVDID